MSKKLTFKIVNDLSKVLFFNFSTEAARDNALTVAKRAHKMCIRSPYVCVNCDLS